MPGAILRLPTSWIQRESMTHFRTRRTAEMRGIAVETAQQNLLASKTV